MTYLPAADLQLASQKHRSMLSLKLLVSDAFNGCQFPVNLYEWQGVQLMWDTRLTNARLLKDGKMNEEIPVIYVSYKHN